MHISAFIELAEIEKKFPNTFKSKSTDDFLVQVKKIINSGFLAEYLMDQYNMIMIIPTHLELDFDGYKKWKSENPITIELPERFYTIYFSE